jgi:hypothetical protein
MPPSGNGDAGGHPTDVGALVEYLRNRFGDSLRSCVVYDGSGVTLHFARRDISETAVHSRVERINRLYEAEQAARAPTENDPEFGPLHASVHVFGEAVVVHLLLPDGSAVGISTDHAVGGRLSGFVKDCLDVLYTDDRPSS